jgi:type I restriction enzyme S subunit
MNWDESKLGDVAKVISGYAFKSKDFSKNNGIPVIKIKNIQKEKVEVSDEYFLDESFLSINSKFHCVKDDVLISLTGSHITLPNSVVGRVAKYHYDFTSLLNQRGGKIVVTDENKLVNNYLYYYLCQHEVRTTLALFGRGGANQVNISPSNVESIKIDLPPLQTQKRIADILSAYDDLIENNLKRIKLLEQAAQNIYKEWFVHLRFPGYENIPINEETGLPEAWRKSPFNDVSFNNNRKRIPVNGTERSKRQGNYRYYGATGVMDYIDDYIFDGRFLLVAEDGTVYDNIGNAYTQLVEGKFWVNNHAHIISGGSLPVEYLYLAMKHYPIGHLITGAVQLKLSMKNLKRVDVINPSKDILKNFMSIVDPMINQVFTLNSQNQKLKAARDILLPRLMNRTIEV